MSQIVLTLNSNNGKIKKELKNIMGKNEDYDDKVQEFYPVYPWGNLRNVYFKGSGGGAYLN